MLRITKDRNRKYSSIGVSVNPALWDSEKNKPRRNCPNRLQIERLEAHAQIELAHRSVESATENLRQNRAFYEAGTTTLTELLDAETLYTQSRGSLTEACASYRTALACYMRVTGR